MKDSNDITVTNLINALLLWKLGSSLSYQEFNEGLIYQFFVYGGKTSPRVKGWCWGWSCGEAVSLCQKRRNALPGNSKAVSFTCHATGRPTFRNHWLLFRVGGCANPASFTVKHRIFWTFLDIWNLSSNLLNTGCWNPWKNTTTLFSLSKSVETS